MDRTVSVAIGRFYDMKDRREDDGVNPTWWIHSIVISVQQNEKERKGTEYATV